MPERTCIGCRSKAEKGTLVRVVHDGHSYRVDDTHTAPGRGAYLHPGCVDTAVRIRAFGRALRVAPGTDGPTPELLAHMAQRNST